MSLVVSIQLVARKWTANEVSHIVANPLQSLVEQVERSGDKLESELVEETEVLIKEFKVHENLEKQLKAELAQSQASLAETKDQISALKQENETLNEQVHTCCSHASSSYNF